MPEHFETLENGTMVAVRTCERCDKPAPFGFGGKFACAEHRQEVEREWVSEGINERASER